MPDGSNVLFVLTDQERYDVTSPEGPDVRTPATDRLAAEGVRFERAYTPIGICSSARASLLTGRYPHDHGMLNNCHGANAVEHNLSREYPTFGELLAEAGYANSYVGKWHVGRDQVPEDFGFETLTAMGPTTALAEPAADGDRPSGEGLEAYQRSLGVDPDDAEVTDAIRTNNDPPKLVSGTSSLPVEATRTYYHAEKTIQRLRRLAETGDPFFHRLDFRGPHYPYVVPEPYASLYDPDDVERWPSFDETFEGKPGIHEELVSYRGVADFDWETWARAVSNYFGFVTFIEEQFQRVLDALEEFGLAGDTVVVKTSDHGDFAGSHRQFNKGALMYEDVYRVPLAVRWPDRADAGAARDEFVGLLDLMPTFLDVAGVDRPDGLHGRSIVPLLDGTETEWRDALVSEYHGDEFGFYSQRMIRKGRYKLVYNVPDENELYDLDADPHELTNLADHPEHADARRALQSALLDWMAATGDPIEPWARRALD